MGTSSDHTGADAATYTQCRDLRCFAETFFAHLATTAWSQMHLDFFALDAARQALDMRGWRDVTAAPRGHAKTTIKGFIKLLHDCLYQHEHYILVCSANAELAQDKVKALRDELEQNTDIRRVYGPQVGELWNQGDFITTGGTRVRAISPRSRVRGLLWRGHRPTKILLDDAEDPEAVLTELRRQRFLAWFQNDVAKLGTPSTNIEIIGTILHPQSFLATLLENPGYTAHFYQAVTQFADTPTAWEHWQQWRSLILDLSDPQRMDTAHAYYLTHEAAMLEHTAVLWPERESYEQLMIDRIVSGETSFQQERQNRPLADSHYLFAMDQAAYVQVQPEGIVRRDGRRIPWPELGEVVAFWDPTPDKRDAAGSDYACCVVAAQDRQGYTYVLAAYLAQEGSTSQQIRAIVDLLMTWDVDVLGVESNNFQSLLLASVREALAARGMQERTQRQVQILPVHHSKNKVLRIKTLEPLVSNRWLQFSDALPQEGYRQLREFLPIDGAGHDDFPDALEGAIRLLRREI